MSNKEYLDRILTRAGEIREENKADPLEKIQKRADAIRRETEAAAEAAEPGKAEEDTGTKEADLMASAEKIRQINETARKRMKGEIKP